MIDAWSRRGLGRGGGGGGGGGEVVRGIKLFDKIALNSQ